MSPAAPLDASAHTHQASLALTASLAAIELDQRLHGVDAPRTATERLVQVLRHTLEVGGPPAGAEGAAPAPAGLVDPSAAGLLSRALAAVTKAAQPVSGSELSTRAGELLERLERVSLTTPPDELRLLRDFCLAVSKSAQVDMPSAFGWSEYPEFG